MYSITRGILRDLPVDHPAQLMHIAMTDRNAGDEYLRLPAVDIVALREQQRSFEAIAAYDFESIHLGDADHRAQRLSAGRVNASLFAVLRVAPLLGRAFTSDDERPGAPRVAILGYQLWQNRYAGDRSVVGRTIEWGCQPRRVEMSYLLALAFSTSVGRRRSPSCRVATLSQQTRGDSDDGGHPPS